MAFDGARRGQNGATHNLVIHVQIAAVVTVNGCGAPALDQFLHDLDYVQQRQGIEPVVR